MTLSVVNEKGGSGKTNIALNLAIKLSLLKEESLLIDSDPQKSIQVFNDIRASKELSLAFTSVSILGNSLASQVKNLKQKYESIIIDTGGRDSEETRLAISLSDVLIIPTTPSDFDIAVLNKMINLFTQMKVFNSHLKAFIVISKASPNPFLKSKINDLKEYIEAKELDDLKLCKNVLYEREAYRSCVSNGLGILEYCKKEDKAFKDFEAFFNELVEFVKS